MIVEVEKQRHGIDLIKMTTMKPILYSQISVRASYHGSTMITTLY